MEKFSNLSKKAINYIAKLAEKKHYVEFFSALLSIPVLITVIILNVNNLKSLGKSSPSPTPQITQEKIYVPISPIVNNSGSFRSAVIAPTSILSPTGAQCKSTIGPISIDSPTEGADVTGNPVNVVINYKTGEYCDAVWSYRINGGSWSDYDDKSVALYNLPQGKIVIDLKVKSIVGGEEKNISRNFVYTGPSIIYTPTVTPYLQDVKNSSASAN